jgi:hypothetical protein
MWQLQLADGSIGQVLGLEEGHGLLLLPCHDLLRDCLHIAASTEGLSG